VDFNTSKLEMLKIQELIRLHSVFGPIRLSSGTVRPRRSQIIDLGATNTLLIPVPLNATKVLTIKDLDDQGDEEKAGMRSYVEIDVASKDFVELPYCTSAYYFVEPIEEFERGTHISDVINYLTRAEATVGYDFLSFILENNNDIKNIRNIPEQVRLVVTDFVIANHKEDDKFVTFSMSSKFGFALVI